MATHLKPEHQRIIDRVIASGIYRDSDEVIGTALEMLCEDIEDLRIAEKRLAEEETPLSAASLRKNLGLDS
jgi:Arc/MetJ-type ribon-helix-helix transcriptional regulator